MSDSGLPRLAYVADVNVQNYCHGSLQLFRLLSGYPVEKLIVIETTWNASAPERRLPGVVYRHHRPHWTRLFHQSRLPGLSPWLARLASRRWSEMGRLLNSFEPEALLTVAHGFSWLAISTLARQRKLPLHLIIHDDWPRHPTFSPSVSRRLDDVFQEHYRSAASRLCVSAAMEESYRRSYGIAGSVLYPTRSSDLIVATAPPERLSRDLQDLTVAFAGTLHPGQIAPMRVMAETLRILHGRLLIFGSTTEADLHQASLAGDHVELRGFLPSPNVLLETMRREADLLYVPVPFDEQWRGNSSLGFPSKLTDYTAAGLPILVHGPRWSSGIKWALQEADSAVTVGGPDEGSLTAALAAFQSEPALRMRFAWGALQAGNKYFSAAAADELLRHCLGQTAVPRR